MSLTARGLLARTQSQLQLRKGSSEWRQRWLTAQATQTSYGLGWGHLGPEQLECGYFGLSICNIIPLLLIYISNFLTVLLSIASLLFVPSLPINLGKTAHKAKIAHCEFSGGSFHGCWGLLTPRDLPFPFAVSSQGCVFLLYSLSALPDLSSSACQLLLFSSANCSSTWLCHNVSA